MTSKSIAASTKLRVAANQRFSCLAMFALMSLCSGCDKKVTLLNTIVFDGYKTPGRIEQAKEMGFTDCKSSYGDAGFECKHVGPTSLLGVKADSATLTLEYKDRFQGYATRFPDGPRTADKLVYREISFKFSSTEHDDRCNRKMDKDSWSRQIECRKNNGGIAYLKHMLTEAGWLQGLGNEDRYYFKENELVSLEFERDNQTVILNPIFLKERDSEIQKIKLNIQKINQEKAEQAKQEAILKKLRD